MFNLPKVSILGLLLALMMNSASAEVVIVVSSESPITSLTRAELGDIYKGRMNSLSGGQKIVPVDQKENSSAYSEFYRDFLESTVAQIKIHWSKLIFSGRGQPPRTVSDEKAMAEFLAKHPNAIGYLSADQVDKRLKVVQIE